MPDERAMGAGSRGEMPATRRPSWGLWRRGWAWLGTAGMGGAVLPGVVWLWVFLILPSVLLVPVAFATRGEYGEIVWTWTLENFGRLWEVGFLSERRDYLVIAWRTLLLAGGTTAVSLLLAYPLAFVVARMGAFWRMVWLVLLVTPLATNLVIRAYGIQVLCDPAFPLAKMLARLGLVEPGVWLFPSTAAVYAGMVGATLPMAVLPLYATVERLDRSLIEAARDLYGGRWRVFRHAVWPQTRGGVAVAAVVTFIPNLGMFVIPDLLGGGKTSLIGNVIQQQFGSSRDYPFGAAVCLALVLATLLAMAALGWLGRRSSGGRAA